MMDRPIFFIGMGRSGTTVIFEAFATHSELGWISYYSARYPGLPFLNVLSRAFNNRFWSVHGRKKQHGAVPWWNRLVPRPKEGYPFWQAYCGEKFLWDYLIDMKADDVEASKLRSVLEQTIFWQGKTRFAAKLTGPPRIHYLHSIFKDAIFVHIVRDGRAVVHSMLNVGFWDKKGGHDSEFWKGAFTPDMREIWEGDNRSPVSLAALQWSREIEVAAQERKGIPEAQFIEVKYEDYLCDPHTTIQKLYTACDLKKSDKTHRYIDDQFYFPDANKKYQSMPEEDIERMTKIMLPELVAYGYAK